ncbi:helix-turn-helix transcriptional regulator [Sulfitobacter sp. 1A12126]|uniref:helix-turn-helix transcriptional regulator n=1 Tax=Sulfitobacter sp. 1A12126 TaxID=3368591 RepID=UPI0037451DEE
METVLSGWLTRAELAAQLKLAVDTLAKWASAGTGPRFIRIGSRTYYREESVREWLDTLEKDQNGRIGK